MKRRALRYYVLLGLMPLFALGVFGNQLYRVFEYNLSPWKGGGMGMFSSIVTPGSRFLKIYVSVEGDRYPVWLRGQFGRETTALRIEPTPEKKTRLLQLTASHRTRILNQLN